MILAFHATDAAEDFERFEVNYALGFHFGCADVANTRAQHISDEIGEMNEGTRIIPVWLDVRKPLRMRDHAMWTNANVCSELLEKKLISDREFLTLRAYMTDEAVDAILKRNGYDAIIYQNLSEAKDFVSDSYLITDPSKIHFALTNPWLGRTPPAEHISATQPSSAQRRPKP